MKQCLIAKVTRLLQQVPVVRNLARQKFVAQFVLALLKRRNVQFWEVAQHLNDGVRVASNETRIEGFLRNVVLDYTALALLLVSLLPRQGKRRLCLDRTEWDFGQCQVNLLLVTVGCGQRHWPLCWELLDTKSGNSNAQDRIRLLDFCFQVLGSHRAGRVVGDREFTGHGWLKCLKDKGISFLMRFPKRHHLPDAQGQRHTITEWQLQSGHADNYLITRPISSGAPPR